MTDSADADQDRRDKKYCDLLLEPLRACATYKPAFGKDRNGVSLDGFRKLYGSDPLYHWIGLDSDFMYTAHKAAGGMTSVYRQLGTGCERFVRAVMKDEFRLSEEQINWAYTVKRSDGSTRTLTLDARLDFADLTNNPRRDELKSWTHDVARLLSFSQPQVDTLAGSVFEIRQGYKSQDAKRQNADMQSAMRARNDCYVFVMAVVSSQISSTLRRRYQNSQMLVLIGNLSGDPVEDTFAFIEQVVGYPVIKFFERNSAAIRSEVDVILKNLLSP